MADDKKIIFSMVGVSKMFPPHKQVLKDIYLSFFYGAKIGIIGLNGSGKSTLLKIIAGVEKSYQGEVVFSPGYSVGYLEQEPKLDPEKTVKEVVQEGVQPILDLLAEYEKVNESFGDPDVLEDPDKMEALIARQAELQDHIDASDAWNIDNKLERAMDALAQGIESWWAKKATPGSRIHAERAIRGVLDNLTAYLQGDRKAQDEMLHAAYESGVAILTTRTTAAHAMSYQITKKLGAAHGHACMLTLPHLWAHLAAQAEYQPMLTELAHILGGEKPMDGAVLLKGLLAVLELDKIPMPDDATLDMLAASVNPERLGNHPEALTTAQLRAIYVQAFTPMTDTERAEAIAAWEQYGK